MLTLARTRMGMNERESRRHHAFFHYYTIIRVLCSDIECVRCSLTVCMVYRMLLRVGGQRKVRPSLHFFLQSAVSHRLFFRHLVVGGGLDGHGILTASGGGTGCEGIRRGSGIVAVVVVSGRLDGHGILTTSGGGTGCEGIRRGGSCIGAGAVVAVDGRLDDNGVCGGGAAVRQRRQQCWQVLR